jgi:sugar lactone lactonase YvrE
VIESIPVIAPPGTLSSFSLSQYTGANTNSVTLSPDEKTLYVTNGNLNNIAVVALNGSNVNDHVMGKLGLRRQFQVTNWTEYQLVLRFWTQHLSNLHACE